MFYWPCCWSADHTLNSESLECLLPILLGKHLLVLQSLAQATPLLEASTRSRIRKAPAALLDVDLRGTCPVLLTQAVSKPMSPPGARGWGSALLPSTGLAQSEGQ